MSHQQRQQYLATDQEVQSVQKNQRAAWNKSFAGRNSVAISAVEIMANLHQGKFEKTPLLILSLNKWKSKTFLGMNT